MDIEQINEAYLPGICCTGSGNTFAELIKVAEYSDEYQKYRQKMDGDFMERFIAVYRVQNKFLEKKYQTLLLTKKRFNVDEYDLLHCTSIINVRSIIEHNLNPRKARRVKFGRGVSFSPDAYYANLHSSGGKEIRAMFVCKVMIGLIEDGEINAIPSYPYDTMMNHSGNVIVKNNDYEFYPTYVLFYRSYPVISELGRRSIVKPSSSNVYTLASQTDEETVREAYIREYSKSLSNNVVTRTHELTDNKSYAQIASVTKSQKSANVIFDSEPLVKKAYGRESPNSSDQAILSRATTYRQYNDQSNISTNGYKDPERTDQKSYSPQLKSVTKSQKSTNLNFDPERGFVYALQASVTKSQKSTNVIFDSEPLVKKAYGRESPNLDNAILSRATTYGQYNDQSYISTNRRDNYPYSFEPPNSEKKNSKVSPIILKILFGSIFSVLVYKSLKYWQSRPEPEPTLLEQPYKYIVRLFSK